MRESQGIAGNLGEDDGVSDLADFATELAEREAILANRYNAMIGESVNECEDCGLLIPSTRQVAAPGCTRCVECATRYEASRAPSPTQNWRDISIMGRDYVNHVASILRRHRG